MEARRNANDRRWDCFQHLSFGHLLRGLKPRSLYLARPPVTHDTAIQDTEAVAATIGRMTPARYGFGGPPE
jgi:hypothetical protein